MALQACNRQSVYCVPLYDSLGENAVEFIINHSESSIIFVARDKLDTLLKALPSAHKGLKTLVYWGTGDEKRPDAELVGPALLLFVHHSGGSQSRGSIQVDLYFPALAVLCVSAFGGSKSVPRTFRGVKANKKSLHCIAGCLFLLPLCIEGV